MKKITKFNVLTISIAVIFAYGARFNLKASTYAMENDPKNSINLNTSLSNSTETNNKKQTTRSEILEKIKNQIKKIEQMQYSSEFTLSRIQLKAALEANNLKDSDIYKEIVNYDVESTNKYKEEATIIQNELENLKDEKVPESLLAKYDYFNSKYINLTKNIKNLSQDLEHRVESKISEKTNNKNFKLFDKQEVLKTIDYKLKNLIEFLQNVDKKFEKYENILKESDRKNTLTNILPTNHYKKYIAKKTTEMTQDVNKIKLNMANFKEPPEEFLSEYKLFCCNCDRVTQTLNPKLLNDLEVLFKNSISKIDKDNNNDEFYLVEEKPNNNFNINNELNKIKEEPEKSKLYKPLNKSLSISNFKKMNNKTENDLAVSDDEKDLDEENQNLLEKPEKSTKSTSFFKKFFK